MINCIIFEELFLSNAIHTLYYWTIPSLETRVMLVSIFNLSSSSHLLPRMSVFSKILHIYAFEQRSIDLISDWVSANLISLMNECLCWMACQISCLIKFLNQPYSCRQTSPLPYDYAGIYLIEDSFWLPALRLSQCYFLSVRVFRLIWISLASLVFENKPPSVIADLEVWNDILF